MEESAWSESRGRKVARRLKTIPPILIGLLLVTALLPVLLIGALVVDIVRAVTQRKPWMALRLVAFLWIYLASDSVGLVAFAAMWLLAGFRHREERLGGWAAGPGIYSSCGSGRCSAA